jgi:hypothetical protein
MVPHAFVSVNRLQGRVSAFKANKWIMDSGAFTTINKYGCYPEPVSEYAKHIKKWHLNGEMLAAVAQDYMCEPFVLSKTGMSVRQHQELTVDRYKNLVLEDVGSAYIMPVLQGYQPEEYVAHLDLYGDSISHGAWVGCGSVCKRNGNPESVLEVLDAIKTNRPDLKLHGFGLKTTSLANPKIRQHLHTSDSMAWSFAARFNGGDRNGIKEAMDFYDKMVALCEDA